MNIARLFFTSDPHFGHRGIIAACKRPFYDTDEMDRALIERWNSVVSMDSDVFLLGDVSFHRTAETREVLWQLNGRIHLVRGNHDQDQTLAIRTRYASVDDYREIKPEGVKIVLCHYPLASWNQMHYGSWHLHGHSHGNMPPLGRRLDVGVDCHNFTPLSYENVKAILTARKVESLDHHQPKDMG